MKNNPIVNIDSLLKDAKEIQKENEDTWFKIFTIFDNLIINLKSLENVQKVLPAIYDLLLRSLQSDRSRLNGISLDLLKKCIEIAQNNHCFNPFLHVLIKLTGKSNKVFVNRAMDVLLVACKFTDIKLILKNINEFIDNPNKNIRIAIYKIIEIRLIDKSSLSTDIINILEKMIEKGTKDPAQEVRNICKGVNIQKIPVVEKEIKKNVLISLTPRKNIKIDTTHNEIIKLNDDLAKISTESVVKKSINIDFFEKLNRLKKERKVIFEKREDDLTPRKLDKYLNKYRVISSPSDINDNVINVVNYNDTNKVVKINDIKTNDINDNGNVINNTNDIKVVNDANDNAINTVIDNAINTVVNVINNTNDIKVVNNTNDIKVLNDINANHNVINNNLIHTNTNIITNIINDNILNINTVDQYNKKLNSDSDAFIDQSIKTNINSDNSNNPTLKLIDNHNLFLSETSLFKNEMVSSPSQCNSIIHKTLNENITIEIPASDKNDNKLDKIIDEYDDDLSYVAPSDLSHSFANMSIEPSFHRSIIIPENNLDVISEYENNIENKKYDVAIIYPNSTENIKNDNNNNDVCKIEEPNINGNNNNDANMIEEPSIFNNDINNNDINIINNEANMIEELSIFNNDINNNDINTNNINNNDPNMIEELSILNEYINNDDINNNNVNMIDELNIINNNFINNDEKNNNSYLDQICDEIDDFNTLNVTSFIDQLSKTTNNKNINNTLCINNINDTVVIDSIQNKDPTDVFHNLDNSTKHSCVELFNEEIFCSDEEPFNKKSSMLKEKPSFSIDIALEPYIEDSKKDNTS